MKRTKENFWLWVLFVCGFTLVFFGSWAYLNLLAQERTHELDVMVPVALYSLLGALAMLGPIIHWILTALERRNS